MGETRKLAAILVADVVGYSRLAGADEDRILARLRTLRSDLIDPTIAVHRGRIVKRTGDGSIIEFRSVVDAVNCAIEVQRAMVERNAEVAPEKRIEFRVGIHLGDVVEESDGDLMGDGVNIAARLEGVAKPGAICLSEQAYWQVKARLDLKISDLGAIRLKNIAEPVHVYSLEVGQPIEPKFLRSATPADPAKAWAPKLRFASVPLAAIAALLVLIAASGWYLLGGRLTKTAQAQHLSMVVLPFTNLSGDPSQDYVADGIAENLTTELSRIKGSFVIARNTAFTYKGKSIDAKEIGKELGVCYMLEGSVQRDGARVRVNAQLVDAESGAHLWADRFEEDVADLFKLQDEVVARLAGSLGWALIYAEAETAPVATSAPTPVASNGGSPAEAKHRSIVVLPFTNLSGDASQDYFADGVTDNLTTELSRLRNSFVIARSTAFTFKGKSIDAKEIGKELGVRYVLEGSVQRDQNRVRVNAQLIDAETGAHLWADRFEEDVADLFKLQDEVVARLGNALGFELVKAEAGRSARSKNPDATDLDMRGWALVWQAIPQPMPQKQNTYLAARGLFDQALKIDADDAGALAGEALTYLVQRSFFWDSVAADYEAKIIGQADRAIALAPETEEAYYAKSGYLLTTQRADEALRAAEAGLGMNPNSARLYGARGGAEVALGRFEQGISDEQQSMRLSPRDPVIGLRHMEIGFAELGLGHFDAAAEKYHEAIDTGFVNWIPYVGLALAHSLEGKTEEAKTALAEARRLNPKLTVRWLKDHVPFTGLETLRKVGLPEE